MARGVVTQMMKSYAARQAAQERAASTEMIHDGERPDHSVDGGGSGDGVVGEKLRGVVSPMTSSDSQKTCLGNASLKNSLVNKFQRPVTSSYVTAQLQVELGVRQHTLADANIMLNPALQLFSTAAKDKLNETFYYSYRAGCK